MVTPESIAAGVERELSRVVARGGRAMIFLETAQGFVGLASCQVDPDGRVTRVFGVWFLEGGRLNELDHAIVTARRNLLAK